jgi:chlorobactene glucosyltransferase
MPAIVIHGRSAPPIGIEQMPDAWAIALGFLWTVLVAVLIVRAARQLGAYRRLELHPVLPMRPLPSVAVIVPARNEADVIGPCLAGLAAQDYPADRLSLVVVDDGSSDGTAAIARQVPTPFAAQVVFGGELPRGWTGKSHACWRGAVAAGKAEYLCFIDADVVAGRDLLQAAVTEARRRGSDLLSLEPRQELATLWERLVIPAGLFALAFLRDLDSPNNARSGEAVANGQFILVRRAVYERLGGHATVRDAICEDSRLARLFKGAGHRVALMAAPGLARARMYRGLGSLWSGLRKNSTETLGGVGPALAAAVLAAPLSWGTAIVPAVLATCYAQHAGPALLASLIAASLASLAIAGLHVEGARFLGVPRWCGLLFPVGYTMAALIAADGLRQHWCGATVWKGRRYSTRSG